jgi:hypothetical protein
MTIIDYPETIRICKEHAKPSCNICLVRAYLALDRRDIGFVNNLFHNPIRL